MKFIILLMSILFLFARELDVEFISEDSWLMGMPVAGGETFDNGIMYGLGLYGVSTVNPFDAVDVNIYFSSNPDSMSLGHVFSSVNLPNSFFIILTNSSILNE